MPFDIRPLLTTQFWFNTNPPPLTPFFEKALFIVYLIALVAALVLGFFGRREKDAIRRVVFEKFRRKETTFGVIGLFLIFFIYERTPFLSMRFFTLLLWVGVIVWGVIIFLWRFRTAPAIARSVNERKEFEKYLPR